MYLAFLFACNISPSPVPTTGRVVELWPNSESLCAQHLLCTQLIFLLAEFLPCYRAVAKSRSRCAQRLICTELIFLLAKFLPSPVGLSGGRLKVLGEFPTRLTQTGPKPSKTLHTPHSKWAHTLQHASWICAGSAQDLLWIRGGSAPFWRDPRGLRGVCACFLGGSV